MEKDLVSVIIPTYNREKYIVRSINSALNQKDIDLEILVIDDGSTDNTENIVRSLNSRLIRYIAIPHSGACTARNVGIKEANGEYIAFLDSDDEWRFNKLSTQLKQLKQSNSDIVFSSFRKIDSTMEEQVLLDIYCSNLGKQIMHEDLLECNLISTQTIFGKKECFEKIGFDESFTRLQDWEISLRLTKEYKVTFFPTILVDVYVQNDSISKNKEAFVESLEKIIIKNISSYNKDISKYKNILDTLIQSTKDISTNEEIKNLNAKLENNKLEINRLNSLIYNIENSTSWKITKPLRKVIDIIKRE